MDVHNNRCDGTRYTCQSANSLFCSRANNRSSILGPLFFIVFMNEMLMSTRTICNVDMHADDSTISACGENAQKIELKLNFDLQEVSKWCGENWMFVIVVKTKIMIVKYGNTSTKRTLTYASSEINSMWSKLRGYLGFMLLIS